MQTKRLFKKYRVDTFQCASQSFRVYSREKRLLLLDNFNLTQYRIGKLDSNLYGLSLLGSLTFSVIYKLIRYCELDAWVQLPDEKALLQQKLIDCVIKMIQRLPDYDMPELTQRCLPYFRKKLRYRFSAEEIKSLCHTTVSLTLERSEQETWHGARVKRDSVVQLSIFAPARSKTNPWMIQEPPLQALL